MGVSVMICVDGEDQKLWTELTKFIDRAGTADLEAIVGQVKSLLAQLQAACTVAQKADMAKTAYPEKAASIDAAQKVK